MTNKTRKHIWPVSLVMSLAIIGALAAVLVLANNPGAAQAQADPCAPPITPEQQVDNLLNGIVCDENGDGNGGSAPDPEPVVGGAPDSYVIEGPDFVDQQANEVSEFVLDVEDMDGLNPDYSIAGGNRVTIRFTRHDEVPDLGDVGGLQPGLQCLPNDARLVDTNLQTQLLASADCIIQLDLTEEGMDRFSIMATMVPDNTRLGISLSTMPGNVLEDTHTLTFLNPQDPPPPEPEPDTEVRSSDCYSVTGRMDQMHDDLADPTQPAVDAEMGQDTIEVLNSHASVQITVTSCEEGPVYIRFLDRNGEVFGTDVDECDDPCVDAAGADVTGLDSGQKLELNLMTTLTTSQALMYDQYTLVEINPGTAGAMERLVGKPGEYYQGKFRFHAPCDWQPFKIQVFDGKEKVLQELQNGMDAETVSCVGALTADPTEFSVTVHTAGTSTCGTMICGRATVRWEEIDGSVRYHVAAIDTSDPSMYTIADPVNHLAMVDGAAPRVVVFSNLVSGNTYLFVAIGELADGSYSVPRFLLQTTEYQ